MGIFTYETRRGLIYGPFSPVYGFGAVVMCFMAKTKKPLWETTLYTGLIGAFVEFMISFLQEKFTGTISWDYSNEFLNIYGRTGVKYILIWGICSAILVYLIYPFISNIIEKIPCKIGNIVMPFIIVFMCLNMFIPFSAVIRRNLRRNNMPPYTFIGSLCDRYYPDEILKKTYNNMIITK